METNPLRKRYKTRNLMLTGGGLKDIYFLKVMIMMITSSSSSSSSSSSEEEDPKSSWKQDVDGKEEETTMLRKRNSEDGSDADFQKGGSDVSPEDLEDGNISFGKRKRPREAMIYDSDKSSDSDVPRKVIAKGRSVISEDDLPVDGESPTSPTEKAANKKRERHTKLQEVSLRQSRKSGKVNQHDEQ